VPNAISGDMRHRPRDHVTGSHLARHSDVPTTDRHDRTSRWWELRDKGKPGESRGRKATGLGHTVSTVCAMLAGLPNATLSGEQLNEPPIEP
jgi:hypothetical protein